MKRLSLLALLTLLPLSAFALTAEERGLEIAEEGDRRDLSFVDSQAQMIMTLKNKQGDQSVRFLRVKVLEVRDDGDKSLTIFDEPRDVKGTALLTFSHGMKPDDQWLYLPALKRVRRISSKNKSGPFMGSEFAYEDIGSQEVEKYTYKYLWDEQLEGKATFVMERYPVDKNSGYTRQVVWMDQAEYIPLKIEFYDRKNTLLKTLVFNDYRQFLDKHWRSHNMFIQNHQTGKSTLLEWKDYQFKNGLKKGDFNRNSLKRAR